MTMEEGLILGPDGKQVQSQREAPCPNCGRPASARVPSAGFGEDIYLICPCGNEFNKELKCPRAIL